jgi:hypothetical protein
MKFLREVMFGSLWNKDADCSGWLHEDAGKNGCRMIKLMSESETFFTSLLPVHAGHLQSPIKYKAKYY